MFDSMNLNMKDNILSPNQHRRNPPSSVLFQYFYFIKICKPRIEEKDRQTQLLCYVSLIRACSKVLNPLVYIGKKFVFLKKNLGI